MKRLFFLLSFIFSGVISFAQNTFPASGNVGIGTSNPQSALQIGEYFGNNTSRITFPGVYNFEWLNMGQQGNGNSFIEFVNHTSLSNSYGIKIGTDIDMFGPGLYITSAPPTNSYASLQYQTTTPALFINTANDVGIGTNSPASKLEVNGAMRITGGAGNENRGGGALQFVGGYGSPVTGRIIIGDNSGWKAFLSSKDYTGTIRDLVTFQDNGNVGIGTTNPQSLLSVKGNIIAQQVTVSQTGWSDFVFNKNYRLKPLPEVEKYIHQYNHLPDIPSAKEIERKGLDLGDMEKKQMQKIEELTCYLMEEHKVVTRQQREIEMLKREVQALKNKIR